MRLLADEQRLGTMELLLTAPVRDWELVVGKWLGGFLFMVTLLALTWIYPIILNQMVDPGIDQGPLLTGYLGLILIVAALVAIGVAVSSLFSNQIAVFVATLAVFLVLWLINVPSQAGGGTGSELLRYLDLGEHYYNTFYRGVIELADIVYFVSLTALALFLGTVSVETRRWR
jgi:ABC-2 type transport system permease protein